MKIIILCLCLTSCSHLKPVKHCLDTVDPITEEKTEYSLCKTLWFWE